jgi:hypothetical protein
MFLNTARIPFVSLRENVTSDDTAITVFKRSNWPSSNIIKLKDPPLHDANGLCFGFFGTDAANETVNYKLLGVARTNGPIFTVFSGAATLGTLAATTHPITAATVSNGLWADTITVTGGLLSGQENILDTGNNRICIVKFDQTFIEELYLEIDIPASGQVASIYGFMTGY